MPLPNDPITLEPNRRRRPLAEAVNGAAGPEEDEGAASRGAPSTSGAGRPPEPPAEGSGQTEPPAEAMETNGEPPVPGAEAVEDGGECWR